MTSTPTAHATVFVGQPDPRDRIWIDGACIGFMNKESRGQHTPLSEEYFLAHTVGELKPIFEPIRLKDYDPEWPHKFAHEAERIRTAIGERALRIEHVGSTSVPDLAAKLTIDMVLVVAKSANETDYAAALEKAGYQLTVREPGWHEHRMFKGPENSVNLHVFSAGCSEIGKMLTFRDWLRASKEDRELYARSKRTLAQREWKYVQNYADAKTAVIEEIISRARQSTTPDRRERSADSKCG